ncbi:MAG: hypothetical protein RLZZ628_3667 [Bacteroidota bacterium]|jgi:hypothetical protein
MKHAFVFLMFGLGFVVPLQAQRSTTVIPRQTEPTLPYEIEGEAKRFLQAFQETVKYLADKNNAEDQKRYIAAAAVKDFAKGAMIEIQNGNKKEPLTPDAYFKRLINLKYEQVKISFELVKVAKSEILSRDNYQVQYEIKQIFQGTRDGKVVYADFTIKTIDMFFVYTPKTKLWTKKYGWVRALHSQRVK